VTDHPPSVVLVTASVGAGHDGPATEMADRIRARGGRALVVDLVELAPLGSVLRAVFRRLLTRWPGCWGRMYEAFDASGVLPAPLRGLIRVAGRRLAARADAAAADLVISTFPLGGRVVGAARRHTRRPLPLAGYVTDPAVHALWLDEFTDRYLVTWDFSVSDLTTRTAAPVALVAPALRPAFTPAVPLPRRQARRCLQLPATGRLALVSSGSWGVGDVLGTVDDLLRSSGFRPVVVCGRNERLRAAVEKLDGAVALGWVDDMAAVMRACDVAVLNSGGLTLAETAAAGLPVVHARPLIGQGRLNAELCTRAAGVPRIDDGADLSAAVALADRLGHRDPVDAAFDLVPDAVAPPHPGVAA
jgi:UDP-N-acetylglucosamine:LPS N-acetylglucosamine transferase